MKPAKWPKIPKRDILRAAQAAYYVLHQPFLSDYEYDQLEKEWKLENGKDLPIGSDKKLDYTETEWALALYFAFRGYWQEKAEKPPKMRAGFETTGGREQRLVPKKSTKKPQQTLLDV